MFSTDHLIRFTGKTFTFQTDCGHDRGYHNIFKPVRYLQDILPIISQIYKGKGEKRTTEQDLAGSIGRNGI